MKMPQDKRLEDLAKFLHNTYETLAKKVGWRTQECCQTPFETLPTKNQEVMLGLAQAILQEYIRKNEVEDRLWVIFAEVKGCKKNKEDCSFKHCHSWAGCDNLIKALSTRKE